MPLFNRGASRDAIIKQIVQLQNAIGGLVNEGIHTGALTRSTMPLYKALISNPCTVIGYLLTNAPVTKDLEKARLAEGKWVSGAFMIQFLGSLWDLDRLVFRVDPRVQQAIGMGFSGFCNEFPSATGIHPSSVHAQLDGADKDFQAFAPGQLWPVDHPGYIWAKNWEQALPELANSKQKDIWPALGAVMGAQLESTLETLTEGRYKKMDWQKDPRANVETTRIVLNLRLSIIAEIQTDLGLA